MFLGSNREERMCFPENLVEITTVESGWSTVESHSKLNFFITIYIVINAGFLGQFWFLYNIGVAS